MCAEERSRSHPLEARLGRLLAHWAAASAKHRLAVAIFGSLIFVAALGYATTELGIRSETEALFPEDASFRLRDARFFETFPQLEENIVLVLEGPTVEATREATERLAARLRQDPRLFPRVHLPEDPFFEENGLLYLSVENLDALADRLARLQPMLAGLVANPSLPGLLDQTRLALSAIHSEDMTPGDLTPLLIQIGEVFESFSDGGRADLDWSVLVDWNQRPGVSTRRILYVKPHLDYASMSAAEEAIEQVNRIATQLGLVPEHGFRLRMTGDMVLSFDEMKLLRGQVAWAGVLSFFVVAVLLYLALRSLRLALATVISLLFGLGLTAGFATLAIGHLNMISVAFAVLFIGLGVDFGIHLCMRFQELRMGGLAASQALDESACGVGSSLLLCAITTAVGFFAFVPTDFIGVAELGVIAGFGMFIGLGASLTILPAILIGDRRSLESAPRLPLLALPAWPARNPKTTLVVALLMAAVTARLIPQLRFDPNPLNVRDPAAESVRVYQDLLSESERSPWTLEALAQNAAESRTLAARFERLPEVEYARTLADYVPSDQAEKLRIIEDMAYFTDWDAIPERRSELTFEAARISLDGFRQELGRIAGAGLAADFERAAASLEGEITRLIAHLEERPRSGDEGVLSELEARLVGGLPALLARLGRAMKARVITVDRLPPTLREAFVSKAGVYRIEVAAVEDLATEGALARFVAAGQSVTTDLAGSAIRIQASADAVVRALKQALLAAVIVIFGFLLLLWRRPGDVMLVIGPLLWAAVMTGGAMVALDIDFNFADVIVLPLLLGIGVDSGIHMVHRARIRSDENEFLLATSTARAVVFSAMTTIASFGTLALVPHRGMANLGQLLVIGVIMTVIANLILLPALIALQQVRRPAEA